jgi:hypothetical protein
LLLLLLSSELLQPLRLSTPMKLFYKSLKKWNNSVNIWVRSMNLPLWKQKKKIPKKERKYQEPINNTIAELKNRLILRTITFFPPNLNALTSLRNIEDILLSVTGARRQRPHQSSGNGTQKTRSGIDGTITNGTTGAHPREDSPLTAGLGIKDSGITTAGSSNITKVSGTDSRDTSGLDTELPSQSSQRYQEAQKSADLSTCLRSGDSQALSVPSLFQDAELDQEERQSTTCGKTDQPVNSSVEDLFTKSTRPVRLEDLISGLELSDASKVQSSPRRD